MNVFMINGSPHEKRCTYTALAEIAITLEASGIKTEIAWIGKAPIRGCQACGLCKKNQVNRCVFNDDVVNRFIERAESADGIIVGTPVHYAGAGGAILSTLDRMFYAGSSVMAFKPAAGISAARRAGTTPAIDQINKYFQINNMPLVSSSYWPMVHGTSVEEVMRDEEGMQTMRTLGNNMAWMLKMIENTRAAGLEHPQLEKKLHTNFIS